MTRDELEKELGARWWRRLLKDAAQRTGWQDTPPEIKRRMKALVDDLYELGVIVDVVDRVPRPDLLRNHGYNEDTKRASEQKAIERAHRPD